MLLVVTAAPSQQQEDGTTAQAAATETVYMNGQIYTQDDDLPWAHPPRLDQPFG